MMKDLEFLVNQNLEFSNVIQSLEDELHYSHQREKKIMYLVYLL